MKVWEWEGSTPPARSARERIQRQVLWLVASVVLITLGAVGQQVWDGRDSRDLTFEQALWIIEDPTAHRPTDLQSAAGEAKDRVKRAILALRRLACLEELDEETRADARVHLAWLKKHLDEN